MENLNIDSFLHNTDDNAGFRTIDLMTGFDSSLPSESKDELPSERNDRFVNVDGSVPETPLHSSNCFPRPRSPSQARIPQVTDTDDHMQTPELIIRHSSVKPRDANFSSISSPRLEGQSESLTGPMDTPMSGPKLPHREADDIQSALPVLAKDLTGEQPVFNGTNLPGISYSSHLSPQLTSKRTSFRFAEQGRRSGAKNAFGQLQSLLPLDPIDNPIDAQANSLNSQQKSEELYIQATDNARCNSTLQQTSDTIPTSAPRGLGRQSKRKRSENEDEGDIPKSDQTASKTKTATEHPHQPQLAAREGLDIVDELLKRWTNISIPLVTS